jgi:ankyrin repeat protein
MIKKKNSLSLGNTKHILDTFCFLLQVCRYLIEAAKYGDVNTTKRWAHCNSDSCAADDGNRNTPLILAATYRHLEVMRVLLEGGADVQRVDSNMVTALHWAAVYGHLEVCRMLLGSGAEVNAVDRWNHTALHRAARYGHLSVVQLLVERGADVRLKNYHGRTAAEEARRNKHNSVADWLDSVSRV